MPLIIGGIVLVLFALLSLSASQGEEARKNLANTVWGALLVSAVAFVLIRTGMPWLAAIVVIAYTAARRFLPRGAGPAAGPAPGRSAPPPAMGRRESMSRDEAYAVLGVDPSASNEAILEAYRRLMKKMHPDQGGSTYLAQRINLARDVLMGK